MKKLYVLLSIAMVSLISCSSDSEDTTPITSDNTKSEVNEEEAKQETKDSEVLPGVPEDTSLLQTFIEPYIKFDVIESEFRKTITSKENENKIDINDDKRLIYHSKEQGIISYDYRLRDESNDYLYTGVEIDFAISKPNEDFLKKWLTNKYGTNFKYFDFDDYEAYSWFDTIDGTVIAFSFGDNQLKLIYQKEPKDVFLFP